MTEKSQYLCDDYNDFLASKMFLGSDAYGNSKIHPWYRYLYICRLPYSFNKIEHKIGITNNLRRRRDEIQKVFSLQREMGSRAQVEMVWVWSMPYPEVVELAVKRFLKEFIKQTKDKKYKEESILLWPEKKKKKGGKKNLSDDSGSDTNNEYESDDEGQMETEEEVFASEDGYTEIINGVAIIPLILYVRLILLHVYLHEKYIPNVPKISMMLEGILGGTTNLIINTLKYNGVKYRALWSTLRLIELQSIKMINAQTKSKIEENKKEENEADILQQIGKKITQLMGQRDETERVCDIEEVYNVLSIEINDKGMAFERYKIPFKFEEHQFQHDYYEKAEKNNKVLKKKKKNRNHAVMKAYNNSIPTPSRKEQIKISEILYISMKVDFDDGSPSIYRFFPAKIMKLFKRKKTLKVRVAFLHPDLKKTYDDWKGYWWKLDWKDEREDFRDCPNDEKFESLWGLWTSTEKTTSNNLEQLNINYKPYQNQEEYEKQEKKKNVNKKQKSLEKKQQNKDYDKMSWATLRTLAKAKDVLNVDGKSTKQKIRQALHERDNRKNNERNNDINETKRTEREPDSNYVQYMMRAIEM
jgi:hypothetical protein